jgi:hypothetical protein
VHGVLFVRAGMPQSMRIISSGCDHSLVRLATAHSGRPVATRDFNLVVVAVRPIRALIGFVNSMLFPAAASCTETSFHWAVRVTITCQLHLQHLLAAHRASCFSSMIRYLGSAEEL